MELFATWQVLSTALEELHGAYEELRQMNDELLASRHMVEASRERYRELFEFAPDGYVLTAVNGKIQEANRAAAGMLGVSQGILIGKPLLPFVAEGDRKTLRARLAVESTSGAETLVAVEFPLGRREREKETVG